MEKAYVGSFVEKNGNLYALFQDKHVRGKLVERKVYEKDGCHYIRVNNEMVYIGIPEKMEKQVVDGIVFYTDKG